MLSDTCDSVLTCVMVKHVAMAQTVSVTLCSVRSCIAPLDEREFSGSLLRSEEPSMNCLLNISPSSAYRVRHSYRFRRV